MLATLEWPKLRATTIYILLCWATPRNPALYQAPIAPSVGPLPLSIGHLFASIGRPSNLRWTPVQLSVCPTHPLGIEGHLHHSVGLLRRATPLGPPSDIEFFSSASLLTAIFIHFPESSSTIQKMHPLLRKLIHC
jgi:hypothetical protein